MSLEPLQVVFVDDDELMVTAIARLLKDDECIVSRFTDPEQGLKFLMDNAPDYLFVDMRMPKIDGVQFLTTMKERGFDERTTIYLCSSVTPTEKVQSLVSAMPVDVVEKDLVCDKTWLRSALKLSS